MWGTAQFTTHYTNSFFSWGWHPHPWQRTGGLLSCSRQQERQQTVSGGEWIKASPMLRSFFGLLCSYPHFYSQSLGLHRGPDLLNHLSTSSWQTICIFRNRRAKQGAQPNTTVPCRDSPLGCRNLAATSRTGGTTSSAPARHRPCVMATVCSFLNLCFI